MVVNESNNDSSIITYIIKSNSESIIDFMKEDEILIMWYKILI